MKTKITLDFEGGLAQELSDLTRGVDLGTLLRDALGEFVATRQPVEGYINRRYSGQSGAEVAKRIQLAELLKRGDVTIELDSEVR